MRHSGWHVATMVAVMAVATGCGSEPGGATSDGGAGGGGTGGDLGGGGAGGSGGSGGGGGHQSMVDAPTIGVIGCSITLNAINGYVALGGERLWPVVDMGEAERPYPGGSVAGWVTDLGAADGGRWSTFEQLLAKYPQTQAIWWELCSSGDSAELDSAAVAAVADAIAERAPGLPIYASASPSFPGPDTLMCTENDGPAAMQAFVDELVASGDVQAGPVLSPLALDQVGADGCHAAPAGEQVWGEDLAGAFGLSGTI